MCQRRSREQISRLSGPCDVGASLFICGNDGAMKHVEACLSSRDDRETVFTAVEAVRD